MSRLAVLLACALLTGCATPKTLYTWGSYEELIYVSYAAPDSVPPELQVEKMEQDYQAARASGKRLPPGWHAQLGHLYFQLGKLDQAQQELRTEKAQFPESAVFIDRLLANLKR
jgi:hypothetical protein